MIVADTNLLAYLFLPSPATPAAESLFLSDPEWVAPRLWRSEFRNVLVLYLRRGLLDSEQAFAIQEEAERLLRGRDFEVASREVLELAMNGHRSAYDCEFVALARALGVRLVTADRRLAEAFPNLVDRFY